MVDLRRTLLLATCVAFAAGCEIKQDENPTIKFVTPDDDSSNNSSSVIVSVDIGRFTLDTAACEDPNDDTPPVAFRGHWHLYLDRVVGWEECTETALLTNVEPGIHELAAELVNMNHEYIHGTPVAFVDVEIPELAPGLSLEFPDDGDVIRSSSVDLSLALDNLVLDTNLGAANVAGHGHIHVAVGAEPATECASTSCTVTDLAPTNPTVDEIRFLTVEFVQNDHSSLPTPVLDQSAILIPDDAPRVAITTPIEGATVGSSLALTFTLGEFQLVDFATAIAESNGQGHYHVLVDGVQVVDDFVSPPPSIPMTPGDHEVRLELRTNQHDPLPPPVVDIVHVTAE